MIRPLAGCRAELVTKSLFFLYQTEHWRNIWLS